MPSNSKLIDDLASICYACDRLLYIIRVECPELESTESYRLVRDSVKSAFETDDVYDRYVSIGLTSDT